MDDARNGYLSSFILFIGLSLTLAGHALEIEYISPERKAELEREFNSATLQPDSLKNKRWSCDMYGVRTRMQVTRDVKLYNWKDAGSWKNEGAQLVRDYKIEKGCLVGRQDRFEDQVKLNSKGQLISQLSVLEPARHVVAYSVCTATP